MKRLAIPLLTLLALAATMIAQSTAKPTAFPEPPPVSLVDIDGFSVTNLPPGQSEQTVLPRDTIIMKRLYSSGNERFLATIVIGGRSKGSIHRPELCLPSQGFVLTGRRATEQDGIPWRMYTLAANAGEAHDMGFAYTFVNQEGVHTSSHLRRIFCDVWDRSVHARIDRWAMITVMMGTRDEKRRLEFLRELGKGIRW